MVILENTENYCFSSCKKQNHTLCKDTDDIRVFVFVFPNF